MEQTSFVLYELVINSVSEGKSRMNARYVGNKMHLDSEYEYIYQILISDNIHHTNNK